MTSKDKLVKLWEWVKKEENMKTEFSEKSFNKNNMLGMQIHNAEASECTKIRWIIEDMLYGEDRGKMEFNEAYMKMKRGAKIKLPEWKGFWYWSEEKQTIIIHCGDGKELDIRETDDMEFTMSNICRSDWIEVK